MGNDPNWTRTPPDKRPPHYLHVSVLVGTMKDPNTGAIVPTRTPPGKGATARRNPDVVKAINWGRQI